jgi:hypothetical protein
LKSHKLCFFALLFDTEQRTENSKIKLPQKRGKEKQAEATNRQTFDNNHFYCTQDFTSTYAASNQLLM